MSKRASSSIPENSSPTNKKLKKKEEDNDVEIIEIKDKTEREKMIEGEIYDSWNEDLNKERGKCRKLIQLINTVDAEDFVKRIEYYHKLFKKFGEKSYIEPPFHCDYGSNITIGNKTIINVYNVFLDCGPITIGNDCLFSPGCKIITVTHPIDYKARQNGMEYTKPVKIGNDCFFGAGCIVLPGVTIGDRVIIGAGSVVTTDIESDCIIGGNPAKVLKKLTKDTKNENEGVKSKKDNEKKEDKKEQKDDLKKK